MHWAGLDSNGLFPRDGFDARRLGQAVYWGIVSDIPTHCAQSKPLSMEEFWAIDAFDKAKLIDAPALQQLRTEMDREREQQVRDGLAAMREEVVELKRRPVTPIEVGKQLEEKLRKLAAANVELHNSKERWKLTAFLLGMLALLLLATVVRSMLP